MGGRDEFLGVIVAGQDPQDRPLFAGLTCIKELFANNTVGSRTKWS